MDTKNEDQPFPFSTHTISRASDVIDQFPTCFSTLLLVEFSNMKIDWINLTPTKTILKLFFFNFHCLRGVDTKFTHLKQSVKSNYVRAKIVYSVNSRVVRSIFFHRTCKHQYLLNLRWNE